MRPGRALLPPLLALLAWEAVVMRLIAVATTTQSSSGHLRGSRWWALHKTPYADPDFDVRQIRSHFTDQQWSSFSPKRCGFDPEFVRAALHGIDLALRECERQMVTEQWNCSRLAVNYNSGNIFGRLLWKGIPETAFTLAIISAGVTASVASECRRSLRCCPCRKSHDSNATDSPLGSIIHAGCDHNTKFARTFSKKLMERAERGRGVRYLAMLHNYNAGRRAIMKTMGTKCLCHGTSGSCTHRICWREVANFQTIGNYLKERYQNAILVAQGSPVKIYHDAVAPARPAGGGSSDTGAARRNGKRRKRRRRKRRPRLNLVTASSSGSQRAVFPRKQDLVYYESSPKGFFCKPDTFWGVVGLDRRICNIGQGDCSQICCRGTYTIEFYKHVDDKCRCRFVWCCDVKCETCITDRQRKICD